MSIEYDLYLKKHRKAVKQAYEFIRKVNPGLFKDDVDYEWQIVLSHDSSKESGVEYEAYDNYFYGTKSYKVVNNFKRAWLHHIHSNPHHWQHWVLINDDKEEGIETLDMPEEYIVEMICDWWSFSWISGDLYSVFSWYDSKKEGMLLSKETRNKVEFILSEIKEALEKKGVPK